MSDDAVEEPWVCEFCKGLSGKPRASSRARSCTSNSKKFPCRNMLAAARDEEQEERGRGARLKRARAAVEEQPAGFSALIAQKRCFKIYEVYGVSYFDLAAIAADDGLLRNGVDNDEREYQYLVRGGFGDHSKDALIPGTRWVVLRELYETCAMANLDLLEKFDKELVQEMKLAREEIMEELHKQYDEEEESEQNT